MEIREVAPSSLRTVARSSGPYCAFSSVFSCPSASFSPQPVSIRGAFHLLAGRCLALGCMCRDPV